MCGRMGQFLDILFNSWTTGHHMSELEDEAYLLFKNHGTPLQQQQFANLINITWQELGCTAQTYKFLQNTLLEWCKKPVEMDYTTSCVDLMKKVFLHFKNRLPPTSIPGMIQQLQEYGKDARRPKFLKLVARFAQHKSEDLHVSLQIGKLATAGARILSATPSGWWWSWWVVVVEE